MVDPFSANADVSTKPGQLHPRAAGALPALKWYFSRSKNHNKGRYCLELRRSRAGADGARIVESSLGKALGGVLCVK
jgi:hypothetical protein